MKCGDILLRTASIFHATNCWRTRRSCMRCFLSLDNMNITNDVMARIDTSATTQPATAECLLFPMSSLHDATKKNADNNIRITTLVLITYTDWHSVICFDCYNCGAKIIKIFGFSIIISKKCTVFPPKTHWHADININELYHNVDNLRLIANMCIILSIYTFSSTKINTLLFFKGILSHCHGNHATCTGKWTLRSDSFWCIFTHNIFFRNLLTNIIHLSHISAFQCRNTIHSVCKIMIKTVTLQKNKPQKT